MAIDRKKFWTEYKKNFGPSKQEQVDAIEFLLTNFERSPEWRDPRHVAYALATIKHETANTFEPITERGSKSYFNKYNGRHDLGNTKPGDGYRFRGRGYVQITGRNNYDRYGIADNPDLALEPSTAFHILTDGMHKGQFTGKKLKDYISGKKTDYKGARQIINGHDRDTLIGGYAHQFEDILNSAAVPAGKSANNGSAVYSAEPSAALEQAEVTTDDTANASQPINVENIESVKMTSTPQPQTEPVVVEKETPSLFVKIGAGITAITGLGINAGALIQSKLEQLSAYQIGFLIAVLGIVALAIWWYQRSAKGANARTMQLVDKAADPSLNNVEIKK